MKVALITGAGGMDAQTLTHLLLSKNYHVILTYRRNSQLRLDSIKAQFEEDLVNYPLAKLSFEICDITDRNSVEECLRDILSVSEIHEVYMLAAMSHVGQSFKQKDYSILANGQSYYYFLENLRHLSPKTRVYGALTSELAGNVPEKELFSESSRWNPKSPYAIGKALGGHWIRFYRESTDAQLFCCFGVLFNHSNTYRTRDFFIRKVTSGFAKIVTGKLDKIKLGNLNFFRDEHWSDFGCEMMWKMLQNDTPKDYVIGSGKTYHGEEYLWRVGSYFNLDWKQYVTIDQSLMRPNEVVRLVSDPSLAVKELGWKPNRMSFKDHIELLCKYDFDLECGRNPKRPNVFELFP